MWREAKNTAQERRGANAGKEMLADVALNDERQLALVRTGWGHAPHQTAESSLR